MVLGSYSLLRDVILTTASKEYAPVPSYYLYTIPLLGSHFPLTLKFMHANKLVQGNKSIAFSQKLLYDNSLFAYLLSECLGVKIK